jgi:hypothetical protein
VGELRRGDLVFVHPGEARAPREVRGLSGEVKRVRGDSAKVVFRHDETAFAFEVDATFLNHDRRRRQRPPAEWSHELAIAR